jgi:hypothetical protein
MKKFEQVIVLAIAGLVIGVIIGEFFPKLFNTGFFGSLGNAFNDPFSHYRNNLAVKYGAFGACIGGAIGLIFKLSFKK